MRRKLRKRGPPQMPPGPERAAVVDQYFEELVMRGKLERETENGETWYESVKPPTVEEMPGIFASLDSKGVLEAVTDGDHVKARPKPGALAMLARGEIDLTPHELAVLDVVLTELGLVSPIPKVTEAFTRRIYGRFL